MSVQICADLGQVTGTDKGRATRVEPGKDQTELKLIPNAAIIDRRNSAPIMVVKGEDRDAPVSVMEQTAAKPDAPVRNLRPHAAADLMIKAGMVMATAAEYGVGVIPTPRQIATTVLQKTASPAIHTTIQPQGYVQPAAQVITPTMPHVAAPVVQAPSVKYKVKLSNAGMGRVTVFVELVSVSDTIIILAYREDGSTSVVEPPECGVDNPVTVEIGESKYQCLYGGWTAELDGRVLIVLVRLPG